MLKDSINRARWMRTIGVMLLPLSVVVLHAQTPTAKVTGTVTDASGAIIPGALVTLVNAETGAKVEGRTNDSGAYLISFLSPGPYSFSVEAPHFRRYVRALTLVTGQVLQLDLKLDLGQTSEAVTVTAETPLIQSATSSINDLVEQAFVKNMPLESGRAGALIRLLPGVTFTSEETFEDHLNFSIGGGPGRSGEYQLDGGNITLNTLLTRSIEFNPPVDAVQEVKVEVNGYPAEYGRSTGGVVSMTTKSGTNEFHGSLYENLRNDDFDARSFFAPSVAPRKYNVFGGSLGGPIRKNSTFFFSRTRGRDGSTARPRSIASLRPKRSAAIFRLIQARCWTQ